MSGQLLDSPPCASARPAGKARAILDAAAALFLAQGYLAVSMDAVARRAGVSKATLYAHFPGKDALFRVMVEEQCARMAAEATASAGHEDEIGVTLERLGVAMLRFLVAPETLAIHRIVQTEAAREPELAAAFYAAGPATVRALLAAWIAEAQARGQLRPDLDPARAAVEFSALLRADLWLRAGLGLGPPPDAAAIAAEAAAAAATFLRAYGAVRPVTALR
jgi:TetR/AcrR family transcriptional repressor of mexJK operon